MADQGVLTPGKVSAPVSKVAACPCGGLAPRCGYCHGKGVYTVVTIDAVTPSRWAKHG